MKGKHDYSSLDAVKGMKFMGYVVMTDALNDSIELHFLEGRKRKIVTLVSWDHEGFNSGIYVVEGQTR